MGSIRLEVNGEIHKSVKGAVLAEFDLPCGSGYTDERIEHRLENVKWSLSWMPDIEVDILDPPGVEKISGIWPEGGIIPIVGPNPLEIPMQYIKEGVMTISEKAVCDKCGEKATHFCSSGSKLCKGCQDADDRASGVIKIGFPLDEKGDRR